MALMGKLIDPPAEVVQRFWDQVHPEPMSGCWLWGRALTGVGYGQFYYREGGVPKWVTAHTMAWIAVGRELPSDRLRIVIDHICENRACCNPAHLRLLTREANTSRGGVNGVAAAHAAQTSCPKCGGSYTVIKSSAAKGTQRICRPCNRAYKARWHRERRLAS